MAQLCIHYLYKLTEKKIYSESNIYSLFLIFQLLHENEALWILKAESPISQPFFSILYLNFSEAHFLSAEHMHKQHRILYCIMHTHTSSVMLKLNGQVYIYNNIHTHTHTREFLFGWVKKNNLLIEECNVVFKYIHLQI